MRLQCLLNPARYSGCLTTQADRLQELCEASIMSREPQTRFRPASSTPDRENQALHPIIEAVGDWIDECEDSTATQIPGHHRD